MATGVTNRTYDPGNLLDLTVLLREMNLSGMAGKLDELRNNPTSNINMLSRELGSIIAAEYSLRCTNKVTRYLNKAHLKIQSADAADFYKDCGRKMNEELYHQLCSCEWIREGKNLIITGPSGSGKTWVGCSIGAIACEKFMHVRFWSINKLVLKLKTLQPEEYLKKLEELEKIDLLILDDIGYMDYDLNSCRIFFELLDTRYKNGSMMLISNYTVNEWYELFADKSYAEAVLSRAAENAYRLPVSGPDLRTRSVPGNDGKTGADK